MWRDVSRSAFVFGIGTFTIVSSSYAKDINVRLEIHSEHNLFYNYYVYVYFLVSQNTAQN